MGQACSSACTFGGTFGSTSIEEQLKQYSAFNQNLKQDEEYRVQDEAAGNLRKLAAESAARAEHEKLGTGSPQAKEALLSSGKMTPRGVLKNSNPNAPTPRSLGDRNLSWGNKPTPPTGLQGGMRMEDLEHLNTEQLEGLIENLYIDETTQFNGPLTDDEDDPDVVTLRTEDDLSDSNIMYSSLRSERKNVSWRDQSLLQATEDVNSIYVSEQDLRMPDTSPNPGFSILSSDHSSTAEYKRGLSTPSVSKHSSPPSHKPSATPNTAVAGQEIKAARVGKEEDRVRMRLALQSRRYLQKMEKKRAEELRN